MQWVPRFCCIARKMRCGGRIRGAPIEKHLAPNICQDMVVFVFLKPNDKRKTCFVEDSLFANTNWPHLKKNGLPGALDWTIGIVLVRCDVVAHLFTTQAHSRMSSNVSSGLQVRLHRTNLRNDHLAEVSVSSCPQHF